MVILWLTTFRKQGEATLMSGWRCLTFPEAVELGIGQWLQNFTADSR